MIKCNIWFTYVFYIKKSNFLVFSNDVRYSQQLAFTSNYILSCDFKGNRQEKVFDLPKSKLGTSLKIFYTARIKYTGIIGVGFTLKLFSFRNC